MLRNNEEAQATQHKAEHNMSRSNTGDTPQSRTQNVLGHDGVYSANSRATVNELG